MAAPFPHQAEDVLQQMNLSVGPIVQIMQDNGTVTYGVVINQGILPLGQMAFLQGLDNQMLSNIGIEGNIAEERSLPWIINDRIHGQQGIQEAGLPAILGPAGQASLVDQQVNDGSLLASERQLGPGDFTEALINGISGDALPPLDTCEIEEFLATPPRRSPEHPHARKTVQRCLTPSLERVAGCQAELNFSPVKCEQWTPLTPAKSEESKRTGAGSPGELLDASFQLSPTRLPLAELSCQSRQTEAVWPESVQPEIEPLEDHTAQPQLPPQAQPEEDESYDDFWHQLDIFPSALRSDHMAMMESHLADSLRLENAMDESFLDESLLSLPCPSTTSNDADEDRSLQRELGVLKENNGPAKIEREDAAPFGGGKRKRELCLPEGVPRLLIRSEVKSQSNQAKAARDRREVWRKKMGRVGEFLQEASKQAPLEAVKESHKKMDQEGQLKELEDKIKKFIKEMKVLALGHQQIVEDEKDDEAAQTSSQPIALGDLQAQQQKSTEEKAAARARRMKLRRERREGEKSAIAKDVAARRVPDPFALLEQSGSREPQCSLSHRGFMLVKIPWKSSSHETTRAAMDVADQKLATLEEHLRTVI